MTRQLLALFSVLLISGCVSTGGNYYGYEGAGDYYYGASAADVVVYSSGLYGYAPGWGYGGGYGYGYGGGYGYGYGGWNSSWGYGYAYPPIWSAPAYPHQDAVAARGYRVERDRAMRSSLSRRDTMRVPDFAKRGFAQPMRGDGFLENRPPVNAQRRTPYAQRQFVSPPSTPVRRSSPPSRQSMPMRSSSQPTPSPSRSAPVPRASSRRQ